MFCLHESLGDSSVSPDSPATILRIKLFTFLLVTCLVLSLCRSQEYTVMHLPRRQMLTSRPCQRQMHNGTSRSSSRWMLTGTTMFW